MIIKFLLFSLFFICNLYADKAIVISTPQSTPKVAVVIPETTTIITGNSDPLIDTRTHIVQSIVERAFIEAKYKVVLLTQNNACSSNINFNLTDIQTLIKLAKEKDIDYLIVGQATAHILKGDATEGGIVLSKGTVQKDITTFSSSNKIYGIAGGKETLVASAEVTAKIISVKDEEIIAIEEAFAGKDGLSQQGLAHGALKEAANILSARLIARASLLFQK